MLQMNPQQLQQAKEKQLDNKKRLEALKTKAGASWSADSQVELDNCINNIEYINEQIDEYNKSEADKSESTAYVVKKGTEKMVHLELVHGKKFDPMTGKLISSPFVQMFTYSEWSLFKNNFKSLGYTIIKILHNPYEDASDLVYKANK